MEWLQSLFSGESGTAVQLIVMVLGLAIILMLIVWIFRRIASTPARKAARNRVPRISITDVTPVDEKRFLVLARRDNVEHLILIGGNGDVVVETGIVRTQPSQQPAQAEAVAPKPALSETVKEHAKPTEPKPEPTLSPKPELAATAAAVTGVAAAAVSEVKDTSSEVISDVASSASDVSEAITAKIDDTIASLTTTETEKAPEPTPTISGDAEVDVTAAGDAKPVENVNLEEPVLELDNLEAELSETLDSALSVDALDISAEGNETAEATETSSGDDEMKKLLDELSRETKTPAQ